MKLIVQNFLNPVDKVVVENIKTVYCPQNFPPKQQLKLRDNWYLYYDVPFDVTVFEEYGHVYITPKGEHPVCIPSK